MSTLQSVMESWERCIEQALSSARPPAYYRLLGQARMVFRYQLDGHFTQEDIDSLCRWLEDAEYNSELNGAGTMESLRTEAVAILKGFQP